MTRIIALFSSFIIILLSTQSSLAQESGADSLQQNFNRNFAFFKSTLSPEQEVTDPAGDVQSDRRGDVIALFDAGFTKMRVRVRLSSADNVAAMHFHCGRAGENGPLAIGLISPGRLSLNGNFVRGTLRNSDVLGADCDAVIGQPINNLVSLAAAMQAGLIYLNVHTIDNPSGELRGQMFSSR